MKPGPSLPAGRTWAGRHAIAKKYRCPTCDIRLVVGEPSSNAQWQGLNLTPEQVNKLLLAAAEFDLEAERHDDRPSAVEFVDWLGADALEEPNLPHARDYDGIRRLNGVDQGEWPPYIETRRSTKGSAA